MTSTSIAVRAAAVISVVKRSKAWPRISAEISAGKNYARAMRLFPRYPRAVKWAFASNAKPTEAGDAVDRWWPAGSAAPDSILVLAGPGGNGKTTTAIRLLVREGGTIIAAKTLHELPLGEDGDARLESLAREPLLVIENLGKEAMIGPTLARICRLIDDRYESQLPTLITTNLFRDGLDKHGNRDPKMKDDEIFANRYGEDMLNRIDGDDGWREISEPSMRGGPPAQLDFVARGQRLADLFDAAESIRTGVSSNGSRLEELVTLPGVGRKTANVVLGVGFGRAEGIVVDTHVARLSKRLGLTKHTDPVKIEKDLIKQIPQNAWTLWSHLLIWHGRRRCPARKPDCTHCEVRGLCPSADGPATRPKLKLSAGRAPQAKRATRPA